MSINLTKGQRIDLTKGTSLTLLKVGLGWEPNTGRIEKGEIKEKKKSFLGSIGDVLSRSAASISEKKNNFDLDSSIFLLDTNNKTVELVYFGNLKDSNECVIHKGDNLTGVGVKGADKENIIINLPKIPQQVNKLAFVVNIYQCGSRGQHFGMIGGAFIHINDENTNRELCRFNLTEDYSGKTALIVGEIYRHNNEWKFFAVGEGTNDESLTEMSQRYK